MDKFLVPTDLAIVVPPLTYGRIAPRSGLAYKNNIDVWAGVIDEDYRVCGLRWLLMHV
jgi:dUTP pyrophosphatase